MTFWNDVRNQLRERTTASDITMEVYRKLTVKGLNMLGVIKPSFYMGQLSTLSLDFIGYVEKFLSAEEGDWGEFLKFILYIRESSKRLLFNIQNLQGPLENLIHLLEELYEGEKSGDDEYDEDPEPEEIEKPDNVNIDDIMSDKDDQETSYDSEEIKIGREEMFSDYEELKEELRVKIRQADVPEKILNLLTNEIADVYQECIQLSKEMYRLSKYPEGDISTLLSILVDINYGLCCEMKKHLLEDVVIEDTFHFDPGLLTCTALFLSSFSDKFNEEELKA